MTTTILSPYFTQSIILGILVASAFLIGVAVAVPRKFPRRVKGNLAAIASSIYFSTLAFSVIEEAIKISSFPAMAAGFVTGAVSFSIVHPLVKERKELTKILSLLSAQGLFQCCLPTLSPFLHCLGQNNCLLYLSSCCIIAGYILHDRNAMRCTDACY